MPSRFREGEPWRARTSVCFLSGKQYFVLCDFNLEECVNAAWKGKQTGRPKGYADPVYLAAKKMPPKEKTSPDANALLSVSPTVPSKLRTLYDI